MLQTRKSWTTSSLRTESSDVDIHRGVRYRVRRRRAKIKLRSGIYNEHPARVDFVCHCFGYVKLRREEPARWMCDKLPVFLWVLGCVEIQNALWIYEIRLESRHSSSKTSQSCQLFSDFLQLLLRTNKSPRPDADGCPWGADHTLSCPWVAHTCSSPPAPTRGKRRASVYP